MSNATRNNNNNNSTSNKNDSAISNILNKHDIKTIHNNVSVPQSERLDQRAILGSKNKNVHEIEKPCHNYGHDVHVPHQMSNETNLKNSIYHIDADDSGWLDNKKIRPMSATSPPYDTTLDKERGRERGYITRENRMHHHQSPQAQPPVYRESQLPIGGGLHHQFSEHKPQKEQQDAKWWRREIQQTQSAPFEDIRSVPTYNEYDCSGRCSNNAYDVHDHKQTRGACHWQNDKELEESKVTRKHY